MRELVVAWAVESGAVGELRAHVTEGLDCWVIAFSSLGNDSATEAKLRAMLYGCQQTKSEPLRRRGGLSPARCPGDE